MRFREEQTVPNGGRTFVTGIGCYDSNDGRTDITFFRYDPRFEGEGQGQILRNYRPFTASSARRVQRLICDGEVLHLDDGRGRIYKRFREWPNWPR
jgi:hypothetical protein